MKNENDRAIQIVLVALLLEQCSLPHLSWPQCSLELGDGLGRESSKKPPAELSELTYSQHIIEAIRYMQKPYIVPPRANK